MGGRGSASTSGGKRISYDSSPEVMRKFFIDGLRKYGPSATLSYAGATPEQRSRILGARNLAAGEVFGTDMDISNVWVTPSRSTPKVSSINFGRGISILGSENPTDAEIRGAAALVRARQDEGGR